jgi:hypothetical protein
MKKSLLLILVFTGAIFAKAQVPQTPLIEHFTQASCGPCASQNPTLKTRLDAFGTNNYVRISHQTSWPGVDPMNANFPMGPEARRSYYGVNAVPNTSLNGGAIGASVNVVTQSSLSSAASNMTPYSITATQTWTDASTVTVDITVTNTTTSPVATANRLYVSMVENFIGYNTAPGSNGETEFEYVQRQMYNASTGAANATGGLPIGSIAASSSLNYSFTITSIPNYISNKREVTFAVYLQNNASRQILQAAKTAVTAIPGTINISAASNSVVGPGYCDYSFVPSIEVVNNDTASNIASVVAEYSIDGAAPVQQTFSGNLTNGQSTSIIFPATTLNPGSSEVSYSILSVNGGTGWLSGSSVTMADEAYSKLDANGLSAGISEDMESAVLPPNSGYTRDLSTAIFDASSNVSISDFGIIDGTYFNAGALGGFGTSNRSVLFRFYDIAAGEKLSLVMQKVNLGTGAQLTFNHAHQRYQTSNDRLEILVSSDCGNTWTSVFNKAGAALQTIIPNNAFFIPTSTTWTSNTVDLSAFNNVDDLIVRFEGTSNFGNNLYLDDITMTSTLSSDDILENTALSLYPNPATDAIRVSGIKAPRNYAIYNVMGVKVADGNISNDQNLNISNLSSGLFFLEIVGSKAIKFVKK